VIYLSILLTLIFIIAYTLAFLFVSSKVGEKLDTKLGLREVHHLLRQDERNMKIHSLVVGANFCEWPIFRYQALTLHKSR
jgi:hypothetical protein